MSNMFMCCLGNGLDINASGRCVKGWMQKRNGVSITYICGGEFAVNKTSSMIAIALYSVM